jgi:hypothetical protein
VTQHIPNKGEHPIRYYGWYSNKQRGKRNKEAEKGELPQNLKLKKKKNRNNKPSESLTVYTL